MCHEQIVVFVDHDQLSRLSPLVDEKFQLRAQGCRSVDFIFDVHPYRAAPNRVTRRTLIYFGADAVSSAMAFLTSPVMSATNLSFLTDLSPHLEKYSKPPGNGALIFPLGPS